MSNRFNLLSDVRPTEFTPFYHQKNIHRPGTTVKVKEKYLPIPKSVSSAYQSSSSNLNSVLPAKRTNDMPQINSVSPMTSSFSKDSQKNTFSR